ncbi:MAG TPA: hypothetical protein VLS53_01200 [Candidatus Dormibacteraeota bacterium]|nr:hypothetical protein [Candidatus Dormibacteraeota bacterium]
MKNQEDIVERLTSFYRDAKLEVPASPPAWNPPQRRSRPAWQPVLASAGLAVVALSLFFAVRVARDQATQARVKASPTVATSTAPTTTASPSAAPSASPDASWVTRRYPVGSVSALLLDSSAVFSLGPAKLTRIDRSSGAVTTVAAPTNANTFAATSAGIWIAAGPDIAGATPNSRSLILVDPKSLAVKRQLNLPGQPGSDMNAGPQLDGGPALLWLGYGNGLYRLNPDTGATVSSQQLAGTATSLSIDPSGQRLYVGVGPSQTQAATVIELDASTGNRIASAPTGGAGLGGPHVAAALDGVWVTYATGMKGEVEHRRSADLSQTGNPIVTSNTIRAVVGANTLWLVDGMAQQLICADPASGATRASTAETLPSAFAADAGGAYLGDNTGVAALQAPASCRG